MARKKKKRCTVHGNNFLFSFLYYYSVLGRRSRPSAAEPASSVVAALPAALWPAASASVAAM